ncbi:hypothetical protein GCM10028805_19700 [Spirosoma harenae]
MRLHGQSVKTENESFPTYQQIKPDHAEIIDFAPSRGTSGQVVMSTRRVPVNLFDYPEKTVTYLLNGKPTMNAKYAKEVLNKKGTQVERINIHEPSPDGKRTIEIEYIIRQ